MIQDGTFRIAEQFPVFSREGTLGATSVCTTVDYKVVSGTGKSTWARASELEGGAKSVQLLHQVASAKALALICAACAPTGVETHPLGRLAHASSAAAAVGRALFCTRDQLFQQSTPVFSVYSPDA